MTSGTLVPFPARRPSRVDVYLDDHRAARDRAIVVDRGGPEDHGAKGLCPDADAEPAFDALTKREWAVLWLLAEGLSDRDIGVRLNIGRETVRTHISGLLTKLGAESRLQALVISVRHEKVKIR